MPQSEASARVLLGPNARIGGKYSLAKRMAHGGMGDVWLARNETTQALVALKILRPAADERTQAEDRFRREARLGGLLTHRSIVRIFDFLEEPDGTLVLVMELLRGETLEELLRRRGAISTREALAVTVAVLSALQHGHDHGVVHRDVKPANIFLAVEPDGHVLPKLLDYGIAKVPRNDTKTIDGLVLGTPSYMSPEQIRSVEDIDGRSDLFATAACMYEMLTGTCAFPAPTAAAAVAAVIEGTVDPDPRIEPRLWIELQRALSKRPKQRHESAALLSKALCAAAGETEASLATALRGALGVQEVSSSGILSTPPPPVRGPESQSIQGQSVASRPPSPSGRTLARGWLPWAAAGALLGTVGVLAASALAGREAAGGGSHPTSAPPEPPTLSSAPPPVESAAPSPDTYPPTAETSAETATADPTSASHAGRHHHPKHAAHGAPPAPAASSSFVRSPGF